MRKLYGFSILELLIAFTIMSSSIISLTALISTLREAVVSSALEKGAFSIATEEINQEYKNDSQNFLSVTSLSTTTNGIYKQSLTVQLNSDGVTKDLTSIVQWKDDWNNSHSIQVSATVSDLSEQPDTAECTFDIKNALPPTDTELLFKDLLPPSLSATTHPTPRFLLFQAAL
jgi:Tfp pilus assembly protein PilV